MKYRIRTNTVFEIKTIKLRRTKDDKNPRLEITSWL